MTGHDLEFTGAHQFGDEGEVTTGDRRAVATEVQGSWVLAAVTVIGAAAALTAWILAEPELGDSTVQLVDLARDTPTALIVAFVVVFLAVNPLVEEVAYGNVAYQVARAGAPAAVAVVLQAVPFGDLHVVGFPAGVTGMGLSFLLGLMLGIIRVMTGGLRVAVIVHVATNATIVALVVLFLLPE